MSNRKQRDQNRANYRDLLRRFGLERQCTNCKEMLRAEGHFVPPSLGEDGFFHCEKQP